MLTWDPPPPEHQNGNITQYIINATVLQSNERLQFFSESTSLVVDTLTPYRTYILFVAASTSVGTGPFTTTLVTIQTPQDGEPAVYDMGLLLIALTVNYFTFINACVLATYIKIMLHCCVSGGATCLGMQHYGSGC